MPILNNIFLGTQKNALKLIATDLELGVQHTIPATVTEGGAITVPARLFAEVVAYLPEQDVQILVKDETPTTVQITCGTSATEILGLPAADFPVTPEPESEAVCEVSAEMFRGMIRQTIFSASTDETRPFLTGVYLVVEGKEMKMVATDGGRLALRRVALDPPARQKMNAIVPAKAMQELARALTGGEESVAISVAEKQAVFVHGPLRVTSRLIAGQFPNYQQVIPQEFKQRIRVNTDRLLQAVRRVSITARDSANVVRFETVGGKMTISSNTPEVGRAREEIEVVAEGEGMQVAFNAKYLLDVLSVLDAEETQLEMTGPLSPGTVRPGGRTDYVYVLAPVRVYT